jgi:hypothetical protein
MIFRNYCAVFFSPTEGVDKEVAKIAEGKPRKIGGTGISIYTFSSVVDVSILTDFFKSFNRNFLLFDLDKNNSGFNLLDKKKEEDLFGFLNNDNVASEYEILSNKLLDDIISESVNMPGIEDFYKIPDYILKPKKNINKEEEVVETYDNLSKDEINTEVNKIIDKGIENLTEKDKKRLKKLSSLI